MKKIGVSLVLLAASAVCYGQSGSASSGQTKTAPAAKPAPKAPLHPAKVVGEPKLTPSGTKYWDIVKGTGAEAQPGMKLKVYYTGWLTNGTKFDSSYDLKPPAPIAITLGAHQVIKGWDEGLVGMKVGGKRQLHIPPDSAYGAKGTPGGPIPPNSELIFDCRLVSAVAASAAPAK
jgi:FKBP-type peptidyl-prolyl cis-trans isomerase